MVALFTPNHPQRTWVSATSFWIFYAAQVLLGRSSCRRADRPTATQLRARRIADSARPHHFGSPRRRRRQRFDALSACQRGPSHLHTIHESSRHCVARHCAARSSLAVHLADVLVGISSVHAGSAGVHPGELLAFLEEAPESHSHLHFPHRGSRSTRRPRTAMLRHRLMHAPRIAGLPPALPEKRTYMHSHVHNSRHPKAQQRGEEIKAQAPGAGLSVRGGGGRGQPRR